MKINNSKVGGNNVTGDLSLFEGSLYDKPVYIWYSEDTFDDKYKEKYPQYFISKDAPEELREKYYNPKIFYEEVIDLFKYIHDSHEKNNEIE